MDGVRVIQMPDIFPNRLRHGGLSPFDWLGRLLYVSRHHCDLVHGLEPRPSVVWPALWMRRRHGVPFIADCADLWGGQGIITIRRPVSRATLGRFDAYWEHKSRARADAVTAISTGLLADLQKHGHPADLTRLVPVGADSDRIKPLPVEAARAAFGLPLDAEVVMHTGFTTYDERLLADTFAALATARPKAWLVLTGGALPLVQQVADQAGVGHRVKHLGFVSHELISLALACGDVMLLPYTNRPLNAFRYPNRFGDYMAAAKPTVSNLTGDMGRTIVEKGLGLCAAATPQAMAEAVGALLDDPERRRLMGQRARQLAEGEFSWRSRAETVDGLYKRLVCG
jgi:glycosyltransferase involved in cell wall biosynthesis